jgi:type IV pilus assembly protein PilM
MVFWPRRRRCSPIGIDIGQRSVKLVQLSADFSRLVAAARWDFAPDFETCPPERQSEITTDAITRLRDSHRFQGREAVLCLGQRQLVLQNLRLARKPGTELTDFVQQEAAPRLPFPQLEAEIRFLDAGDVRQGENTFREVIVAACHRPVLHRLLETITQAAIRPVAIDIEPLALSRSYALQFQRDEDRDQRVMFVHIGYSNTVVAVTCGSQVLFVKYVDNGGRHLDEAVAARLQMTAWEASALRRFNGDRRRDAQDPEVTADITRAIRPVTDRLLQEVALCWRYHSVTFRGQSVDRVILGGGDANLALLEALQGQLNVPCALSEALRRYPVSAQMHPLSQWDVAAGLAMRKVERSNE